MRIEGWQLSVGERTINLRVMAYVIAALLVVIIAFFLNRILGYLKADIKNEIDDILAILAILYAAIQFIDARLQKRETNQIAKSMSTRFIGLFPKNLIPITEVIARGSKYIYIMADFADYGSYSSPNAFEDYLKKIKEALNNKVPVRIMCYNKQRADEEMERQFPDKQFSAEVNSRTFRRYFDLHCGLGECKTAARLREILNKRQNDLIDQLKDEGAEFRYFPGRAEFFLWLEDDEEAVFAFKDLGNQQKEFSFRTLDTNLIRQFKYVFHQRWTTSDQLYDKPSAPRASMTGNP